jgi:hypothetical protein
VQLSELTYFNDVWVAYNKSHYRHLYIYIYIYIYMCVCVCVLVCVCVSVCVCVCVCYLGLHIQMETVYGYVLFTTEHNARCHGNAVKINLRPYSLQK